MLNTQTINTIGIFGFFVSDDGKPVEKTKFNAPYNYDDFILWDDGSGDGKPENFKIHSGAYSDRMMQWDFKKFNQCLQEVFGNQGQYFNNREPKDIEKFLRLYFDKPTLRLVRILESCNQASGYPLWYFRWIAEDQETPND